MVNTINEIGAPKVTTMMTWKLLKKLKGKQNRLGRDYTKSMVRNWLYNDSSDKGIKEAYLEVLKDMGINVNNN